MTDPLDVCVCGDYRRQHANGTGRCLLGDLCTPHGCGQFRLFRAAALGYTADGQGMGRDPIPRTEPPSARAEPSNPKVLTTNTGEGE